MRRRLALFALALTVLGAGCGSDTESPQRAESFTVVLDWTPNTNHAGVYLAKARGFYRDAGLDVTIVEPDPAGALGPLAAGRADAAFSYAEQILPARAQGAKVISIATVLRTNTSSLAAPVDRGINRPRDLAGKTYGGYGAELERHLVEALMRCDGADPATLRTVEVGNADYTVGFRKKRYDAVWVFDGWDVIRFREIAKLPVTTIRFRDWRQCIPDWYTPIIATSEELLARDPERIQRFLAATAKGYELARSDPAAAARAVKDAAPESDMALLEPSARFLAQFLTDDRGSWGRQDPLVWRDFNAFLRDRGLTTITDAADAFSNDYLPAAVP